ncbi:hypothetical protein [Aureibacter tunicatorum]|uniref:Uncharacterized protein n=1 Tax=Aureibacter tunicatorum TaxID=866807 RepID=A0AAE3XTH4_9BACT|nr:hypothetical protein [Aureibacter tunicatorum]MDR6241725.1 hypothetical protein [Aureibacter tunicatorum]BDD07290.1 hypothetical protein AUTU_47730 [Aureibacter tunicatorum]
MPIDINGWIEYSPYTNEQERKEEYTWFTWMDVSSFIRFNVNVNWVIFGNPRDFQSELPDVIPIAKNRGLPNNLSYFPNLDVTEDIEYEKKNCNNEIFGFTHFYFSEIDRIDWLESYQIDIDKTEWGKLFALTKEFQRLKKIQSNQIRFTVWYNW